MKLNASKTKTISLQVMHNASKITRIYYWRIVNAHLRLLDRVLSGASFLTGGVFECDLAHRRSVAVLCMLYKIRCNSMHPLYCALPVPYVPVQVTRGAAHRYTLRLLAAEPLSITGPLFPGQCLCGTILVTQCSMV